MIAQTEITKPLLPDYDGISVYLAREGIWWGHETTPETEVGEMLAKLSLAIERRFPSILVKIQMELTHAVSCAASDELQEVLREDTITEMFEEIHDTIDLLLEDGLKGVE